MEWENLTLILASAANGVMSDDPAFNAPPEYRIPFRKGISDEKPSDLIKKFISDLVALLVNPWVPAQVIARDALGVELTPKVFPVLFEHLDACVGITFVVLKARSLTSMGQAHPRDVRLPWRYLWRARSI
jgi:hypothetical protein